MKTSNNIISQQMMINNSDQNIYWINFLQWRIESFYCQKCRTKNKFKKMRRMRQNIIHENNRIHIANYNYVSKSLLKLKYFHHLCFTGVVTLSAPMAVGSYNLSVSVTDSCGRSQTQSFTVISTNDVRKILFLKNKFIWLKLILHINDSYPTVVIFIKLLSTRVFFPE